MLSLTELLRGGELAKVDIEQESYYVHHSKKAKLSARNPARAAVSQGTSSETPLVLKPKEVLR